jgi:hypothetical protein
MRRKKAAEPPKKRKPRSLRALADSGLLTPLQSRWAIAFAESRNKRLAAIAAGYKGNPSAAGYQVFKTVAEKAPDVIAKMGITLESVIENYILPQMNATETRFAQHEGKFTDQREVVHWEMQHKGTRTLLELMNAFPPEDPMIAAQVGVKVINMNIPFHPNGPKPQTTPTHGNEPQKQIGTDKKLDPRPTD